MGQVCDCLKWTHGWAKVESTGDAIKPEVRVSPKETPVSRATREAKKSVVVGSSVRPSRYYPDLPASFVITEEEVASPTKDELPGAV